MKTKQIQHSTAHPLPLWLVSLTALFSIWGIPALACFVPACRTKPRSDRTGQKGRKSDIAIRKRHRPPTDLRIPGRSVPLGSLARIDDKVLSIAELRRNLTTRKSFHFAAVLLQTPVKSLNCLAKQAEHHKSCPPPYFTFGDTEPYAGSIPKRLGARVLVMMNPQSKLETHHTYVVLGQWCPDRNLARFCARAVWRVPDEEGRRFWRERVTPLLPKRLTKTHQASSRQPRR